MKAVAVDVGGGHVACALVHEDRIVARRTLPVDRRSGFGELLPRVTAAARELLQDCGLEPRDCAGVALAFCGIVDVDRNRMLTSNDKYPDAAAIDLESWARSEFGLPVAVENDARMALLGERHAGSARGFDDVVMFTLGTGVGGAAMINGRLLRGRHYQAGCLGGHTPVVRDGRPCTCGNVEGGDAVAREILDLCVKTWAAGAVALVHAFDPEIVVFGGGVMRRAEAILPGIRLHLDRYAWTPWGKLEVRAAALGNDAALLGAVPLLAERRH